jgi:hypothetical protein
MSEEYKIEDLIESALTIAGHQGWKNELGEMILKDYFVAPLAVQDPNAVPYMTNGVLVRPSIEYHVLVCADVKLSQFMHDRDTYNRIAMDVYNNFESIDKWYEC